MMHLCTTRTGAGTLTIVLAALGSTNAAADTRAQVRVSADGGYETNAFLLDEDQSGAFSASIEVEPTVFFEDERSSFRIDGSVRLTQYTEGLGTEDSYRLSAGGQTRLDERTTLNASARFQSSRTLSQYNLNNLLGDPLLLEPGEFPDVEFIDPTLAGVRGRNNSLSFDASVSRVLSPRDSLSIGVNARHRSTERFNGRDFREAGLNLGWGHQLTPRASLQTSILASKADYLNQTIGDGKFVTPLIGVQYQLSPTLDVTGQVGVSLTSIEGPEDRTINDVSFAANGSLCKRGLQSSLCINGARQASPTTYAGIRTTTTVAGSYSRALSEFDRLSVSASYARADQIDQDWLGFETDGSEEIYGASAQWRRFFSDRLSGYVRGGYSKTSGRSQNGRDGNLQGFVGISYTFGEIR